jgi:SAM-dependent methyltransferase
MKSYSPSAERNRDEILGAIKGVLPAQGTILEIASGSGQHALHFAPHFPQATWQPSDRSPEALASIRAYAAEADLPNLRDPLQIDARWAEWPLEEAAAVVCCNMLHISSWETCVGLLAGAARTLRAGGPLYYYGALIRADRETAPSNLDFDRSLRARDPSWGVRHLEAIVEAAAEVGLEFDEVIDMPNNNYSLVLRQPRASAS